MKILIATGIYPPDIGGPATYSALLREELPHRGIDVVILTFGEVRYLPKIIRHAVFFCKALIRGRGCKIIYAQDPVSVGLPSFLVARLTGKKFFIRVAGDYAWEQAVQRYGIKDTIDDFQGKRYGFKTGLLRTIQRFVVGHADQVITPSIYFRRLVSDWNNGRVKVTHIYNGIELPELEQSKQDARNELGIPEMSKVIMSAGRLVPWKGFFALIDVINALTVDDDGYRLYIVGTGPDKEKLQSYIKENRLENEVFLTGAVSRDKVFSYLIAADVFVLNTSFESFSFQIVEAMHAGTPVVSTNIGNIAEIIDNRKEGVLIAPDDKAAVRRSIEELMNNADLREMLVRAAKLKAGRFSIENTLDNLCKLLGETIPGSSSKPIKNP